MEEKNFVCILLISKYIGQHQRVLSSKSVDLYWYSKYIFLSLFVIRHFRGKSSYNEILKGYMAVESLGILVLYFGDRL